MRLCMNVWHLMKQERSAPPLVLVFSVVGTDLTRREIPVRRYSNCFHSVNNNQYNGEYTDLGPR